MQIALSDIEVGDRFRIDHGNIEQLAYDINKNGLITPIAIAKRENVDFGGDTDKPYVLLAGGRRHAAMVHLGWTEGLVRIYDRKLSHLEMRTIELAENLMRKDMEYAEDVALKKKINDLQIEIHGVKISNMPDAPGWSQADTANFLGKGKGALSEDLKLADAIDKFPELKLGECKNKSDAMKRLKKVTKTITNNLGAQDYTSKMSDDKTFNQLSKQYIVGDFFEKVKGIPDKTVDLVEIDPPYAIDLHKVKKDNECIGYNEVPVAEYKDFMSNTLAEAYRIMREGSWLIVWFAADPWFDTVAQLIEDAGFKMNRIPGIWVKPQGQTAQPETFMGNSYEMFFYARKGKAKLNEPGRSNVFQFNPVSHTKKYHPTQRPFELICAMLNMFTKPGSNVFVPFLGSGNTIISAHACQMTAIGTDLTSDYKDGYIMQLKEVLNDPS